MQYDMIRPVSSIVRLGLHSSQSVFHEVEFGESSLKFYGEYIVNDCGSTLAGLCDWKTSQVITEVQ